MTAPARPPRRSLRAFWLFAAVMAVAVLGGGAIVLLNHRSVREYQAEQARVEAENAAAIESARSRADAKPDDRAATAPGPSADSSR
ncbi:hypothetical protein [Anaeromyxobacter terrae]|uniref:hypothetical protein n=1 Tax=Anaeromyxobacter terrae TaxID=2925406 RepID=UPI001F5637CB|nr:hypothetical protein [Anaeromyxobacter sp. SG22]